MQLITLIAHWRAKNDVWHYLSHRIWLRNEQNRHQWSAIYPPLLYPWAAVKIPVYTPG